MKKQILFLAIFSLAVLAGTNNAWGQLLPGVTNPGAVAPLVTQPIDPLSCIAGSEPLHPFAGVPYRYSLTSPVVGTETASSYTWWATQDPGFITGPVTIATMANTNFGGRLDVAANELVAVSNTYGVTSNIAPPVAGVTPNEVTITWSAGILAATKYQAEAADAPKRSTFVVGYAEGTNCADNIQIYEINPVPNFTIDIAAIDTSIASGNKTLAWDAAAAQCVDDVQSATYNTGTHELDMDYGENNFYFEVAAANFVENWHPIFSVISGLETTQEARIGLYETLAEAQSGSNVLATSPILNNGDLNPAIPFAAGGGQWDPGLNLTAATPADAATGVSLYVRVTVYNNTHESLAVNPFVLAVDARDNNNAGIWDLESTDCPGDPLAADEEDQVDRATMNINPRPTLNHNTIDGGTPNPTTTVPKPSTTAAPNF